MSNFEWPGKEGSLQAYMEVEKMAKLPVLADPRGGGGGLRFKF